MRKYCNFITFRLWKISENTFSLALKLIELIESGKNSSLVLDMLQREEYSKLRYERKEKVNCSNKEIAYIGESSNQMLKAHLVELQKALMNDEEFFYIFIYNKKESIKENLSSLQFYFLIKQNYKNCLLSIYDTYMENEYYLISHFLYFETSKNKNGVLYKYPHKSYQTLQLENIGALTKFIPLIEIDMETYNLFSLRISELWDNEGHINNYSNIIFKKIWQSCMVFMDRKEKDNSNYFKELDEYKGLSFLAFYILQFYMFYNKNNKSINNQTLRFFVLEIADGILQLVENVCMHTECGKGYLSIVLDKQEKWKLIVEIVDYIKSNYQLKNTSVLNHKFIENLQEDDVLKESFRHAHLKDFFEPEFVEKKELNNNKFYGNDWEEYYKRPENAAFHYGLQMFASVVKGYLGCFYVRSGYTYSLMDNESYFFGKEKMDIEEKPCFPGTYYKIEFPMIIENVQKNIGFNSKISDQVFKDILKYSVETINENYYHELIKMLSLVREKSQLEKENKIRNIKEFIKCINNEYFRDDKYFITRIPFECFISGQMMEYFCKAVFLYIKELRDVKLKVAITGCSEECILEFVRWFLIFYDKHNNCQEMKNVEIYLVGVDSREDFLLSGKSLAISQGRVEKVCMSKGVFNQRQRIISQAVWRKVEDKSYFEDEEYEIIPYDVIVDYSEGEKIFENAVLRTLDTDLQKKEFGCKVENCHVRIGSKIHITDNFYEAHSLFHSNYYTSRFAFLLAKKMMENLLKEKGETFYERLKKGQMILIGYETYSELLICEIKKILKHSFGFNKVDHIIFDSGNIDEFRLWSIKCKNAYYVNIVPINSTLSTHNKMIALYSKYEMNEENILANYAMILIRDSEYTKKGQRKRVLTGKWNNQQIMNNQSKLERRYWNGIDVINKKVYTPLVKREVDYMILIENNWNSPLECECCYPQEVDKETPLIETNKASVVPTFMIGMKQQNRSLKNMTLLNEYERDVNDKRLSPEIIDYTVLMYAHLYRNGNDYRFYINSENLYKKIELYRKDDINKWCRAVRSILKSRVPKLYLLHLLNAFLKDKRAGKTVDLFNAYLEDLEKEPEELQIENALDILNQIKQIIKENSIKNKTDYYESIDEMIERVKETSQEEKVQAYDIIVSPVHHSNATWIDQVTENIFENMPAILHFDVQKEFRDNMKTKYSNLTMLYYNLCSAQRKFEINFHYVDDTIISGKTFNRAKTLIQSLFPMEAYSSQRGEKPKVNLFKSVIVLFNRLSNSSKLFYVKQGMFFSYIDIYVPNLRNHEDACIMCKLVSEMNKVKRRSATNLMAELFERKEIKHLRIDEMQYSKVREDEKKNLEKKNYKRLYCNHKIFEKIGEIGNVRNDAEILRKVMLELINDKTSDKRLSYDERMEWVISYFKIYSRPVVTFRKSFLEAYFGIAIHFMEFLPEKLSAAEDMEPLFSFYCEFLEKGEKKKQLLDSLIKTLLGGLGRVKSNYIIREYQIIKIFEWYSYNVAHSETKDYIDFKKWYVYNVKRLIELSGDETKCLWLEKMLLEGREWKNNQKFQEFQDNFGIKTSFGRYLYIENTRLIYDAVSDLYKNFYFGENENILREEIKNQLNKDGEKFIYYYVDNFFRLVRLNRTFCTDEQQGAENKIYESKCINRIAQMVKMYKHLNRGLESQIEKQNINEIISINDDYVELLNYMKGASDAVKVFLLGADKKEDRLKLVKEFIRERCDWDEITDEIREALVEDTTVRLNLYHIANSKGSREEEKNYNYKRELLNAEKLLENFENNNSEYIRIGKTIIINFKMKRALVKIHNNWDELRAECQKKNINKVHVDPFYFYFDFSNSTENEIMRGLRNVLTFRDSLVRKIEEDFNNNLIQLSVASQKQAKDLSSDRAAGHTKKDEISYFMGYFIKNNPNFETFRENAAYKNVFKENNVLGSMLKLLADSYCSHKFREYYPKAQQPLNIDDLVTGFEIDEYRRPIRKYINVFNECVFKKISSSSKDEITAEVCFEIDDKDIEILCIEYEEIWVLFIVLLIQNALNHGVNKNGKVLVRIYIENQYIVAENNIAENSNCAGHIKDILERVPEGKADGISLWVMDQCIRDIWRKYYWKLYTEYIRTRKITIIPTENIISLMNKLQGLEKSVICAEQINEGNTIKIKLPIIHEKKEEKHENIMV